MKQIAFLFSMAIVMLGINPAAQAQPDAAANGAARIRQRPRHLKSTRAELAQLQKDLSAVNIGFRHDMVDCMACCNRFALPSSCRTAPLSAMHTTPWVLKRTFGSDWKAPVKSAFRAGSKCAE